MARESYVRRDLRIEQACDRLGGRSAPRPPSASVSRASLRLLPADWPRFGTTPSRERHATMKPTVEQHRPQDSRLGRSHAPLPLAYRGTGGGSLCDVAIELDGLGTPGRVRVAHVGAVPDSLGVLWQRDDAVLATFSLLRAWLIDIWRTCSAASPIVRPGIIQPAAGWCCSSCPAARRGVDRALRRQRRGGRWAVHRVDPAPIANAITSLHLIFWDALLAAVGLHVLGGPRLRSGEGAQPGAADDHRLEDPAGQRAPAAHGGSRARDSPPQLQRPRRRCARQFPLTAISSWEVSPDRGSRPRDGLSCGH